MFCVAKNNAVLEGLLTVYHVERSTNALVNVQNTLPLLSQYDKEAIEVREGWGARGFAELRGGGLWARRACPGAEAWR